MTPQENLYARILKWLEPLPSRRSIKEVSKIDCTLGSTGGFQRLSNEDQIAVVRATSHLYENSFLLFIVLDGMGGLKGGADCAQMALSALVSSLIFSTEGDLRSRVKKAIQNANYLIFDKYKGKGGTTIAALIINHLNEAVIANVGDSRIYEFAHKKFFKQISIDDTLANAVRQSSPKRNKYFGLPKETDNQLIQFVGMGDDLLPHVSTANASDTGRGFLLVTDGAYRIPPEMLEAVINHASSSNEIVERLVELSEWVGGLDNASAICFWPTNVGPDIFAKERGSSVKICNSFNTVEIQGQIPTKAPRALSEPVSYILPFPNDDSGKEKMSKPKPRGANNSSKRRSKPGAKSSRKNAPQQIEIKISND